MIKKNCKERSSNLELFRIIAMLIVVAHHYVVNSGLSQMVVESKALCGNDIFLALFGWGGKTAINCFVLITGYFMCTSKITLEKFMKLFCERYFYAIAIWCLFLITKYESFSFKSFLEVFFPFFNISTDFYPCFLLFYLFIPFLNKLIKELTEREHLILVILCLFIYTLIPSFAKGNVTFNYITWFVVLYFVASYLRLYPKPWFENLKLWGGLAIFVLLLSWLSVVALAVIGIKMDIRGIYYFFVADSNKILAFLTALCSFMFFKNLNIRYSKFINSVAASTFGVLLIHANSDTMRKWLWKDVLNNTSFYHSPLLVIHAISSVIGIYIICTLIDWLRIRLIENPLLKIYEDRRLRK